MNKLLEIIRFRKHEPDAVALSALLDGQLETARADALRAHVDGCTACRARLDELRAVRASLRAMPQAGAPRSFRLSRAAVEATARRPATRRATGLLRLAPAVSAAAVIAFAAIVGADVYTSRGGGAGGVAPTAAERQKTAADNGAEALTGRSAPESSTATADQAPQPGAAAATPPAAAAPPRDADGAQPLEPAEPGQFKDTSSKPASNGSRIGLRVAEGAVAAVALAAGALAFAAYRRRRNEVEA